MTTDTLMNQLMGLSRGHLEAMPDGILLHREVIAPFLSLREAAGREGIDLAIASGHRDFARQLVIWNDKATGRRVLLAVDGKRALDAASLPAQALMHAILRWSALPGASRHHWGTDMDVWDRAAVPANYCLQLTPEEYSDSGPFARLNRWMAAGHLEAGGFFRPYAADRGGVSPEPWHISYRPLADRFSREFDVEALKACLAGVDIALKDDIIGNLDALGRRYFCV